MLGKPEWFKMRKYGGWGIMPRTWQGWVYILGMLAPLFIINNLPFLDDRTQLAAFAVWAAVFAADAFDIMIRMPKDERERQHEAFAERNAMWAMVIVLTAGVAFRVAQGIAMHQFAVDPIILIALFCGLAAKAITNIYLDRHN
ncbi:MAG: hypothetical protein Q7S09_05815 [bacterium]|nr:hypothetical protein [bacterium]